jgi:hypothetical protein
MKCVLVILLFVALVGCGSKDADPDSPTRPDTKSDAEMVRRSDVDDILSYFMLGNDPQSPGNAPPITVWRSDQRPVFVFDKNIPTSGLFTDQESRDFVDHANKKVDELSSGFAGTVESVRNVKKDPPQNDETTWLVMKYRNDDRGPYSLVVRLSTSDVASSFIPIGLSKDLIEQAYTRAAREQGELVLLPDELKYRLGYPDAARVY